MVPPSKRLLLLDSQQLGSAMYSMHLTCVACMEFVTPVSVSSSKYKNELLGAQARLIDAFLQRHRAVMVLESTSPYFCKNQRLNDSKLYKRSRFFDRSACSALGSTLSLGSLLECLGLPSAPMSSCCELGSCVPQGSGYQSFLKTILTHFGGCEIFMELWESDALTSSERGCMIDRLEAKLHMSVRHLCSKRCYMRAFTPYRKWAALRRRLLDEAHELPTNALRGWRCTILPPCISSSFLPKARFVSPAGETLLLLRR